MNTFAWGAIIDQECNLWLPISNTNSLVKGENLKNLQYVGELPCQNQTITGNCILKALETDEQIVFFARETYEAWSVDKKTLVVSHILYCDTVKTRIADIVRVEHYAVVLPYSGHAPICIFDLDKNKAEKFEWENKQAAGTMNFIRAINKNNCVYTAVRALDNVTICKINITEKTVVFDRIDVRMINAINIEDDNWWVFALSKEGDTVLYKYSEEAKKIVEKYVLYDIEPIAVTGALRYFKIEKYNDKIYFIPALAPKIYVYDIVSKTGRYLEYPKELESKRINNESSFLETQRIGNDLYLFPCAFTQLLKLNLKSENIEIIELIPEVAITKTVLDNYVNAKEILKEKYPITLDDYVKML